MTEEERAEAAIKLSELSQHWQEYHRQDRLMHTLPDEKSRFVAYHAMQAAAQQYFEVSAWFVRRRIALAYDAESKEYVALTDPPVYPARGIQ